MPSGARPDSYWNTQVALTDYPRLEREVEVDVAVVGGGIAGLTAAHALKLSGKRVALIEARRVGRQVTGHSNAKITTQHSLIYADLIERLGLEAAQQYADANQAALERIIAWTETYAIECELERCPAYTFTQVPDRAAKIEAEYDAAIQLGLPASMHSESELPYPIEALLRFDDQAQFNPTAYLAALAARVDGDASYVFEETRVLEIEDGEPAVIKTAEGAVRARDVIVATNLPIVPAGDFHKRTSPRAHVAVAAPLDPEHAIRGMYLGIDPPTHSLRTAAYGDRRLLILVGESFVPGTVQTSGLYQELKAFARDRFGVDEFVAEWANMDFDSQDRLPFIGRASQDSRHVHVATGFSSWGITGGTAAGMILTDTLLGRANPWAGLFDATREPGEAANQGQPTLRQGEPPEPRTDSWDDLKAGEGAVFQDGEEQVAAYRDEGGHLILRKAECTHLGCPVHWNEVNRTWDCACHGSTFDVDGSVIHAPAVEPLAPHPPSRG